MPQITDKQVEQARSVDLLTYLLTHEPESIRKCGANEYCLVEHDSFKMSNGKWFWHSQGFGGYSALDYLIKVQNVDFTTAVTTLTDNTNTSLLQENHKKLTPRMNSPPKPEKPFTLPKPNINNDRVIAYLRGRGIGKDIINRCINAGILYESASHRCVFVGKDGDIPKSASERGTEDGVKKDVFGSNKQFGFVLPPENTGSRNLAIFESPVDTLSHHCIHKIGQTAWDGYRLSLGGVGSKALFGFLERHSEIESIHIALDNDKAGKDATHRIIKELLNDTRFSHMKITITPPPIGKDYADTLQAINHNMEQAKSDRQMADILQ